MPIWQLAQDVVTPSERASCETRPRHPATHSLTLVRGVDGVFRHAATSLRLAASGHESPVAVAAARSSARASPTLSVTHTVRRPDFRRHLSERVLPVKRD
jgi:hypothetical protein